MNEQRVLDAVTSLVSSSIDTADRDDLAAVTSLNATLKAYTAYVDVRIARRANALKSVGESAGGFATVLDGNGSARDAKAAEERDRACATVPGFEDALADGDVSAEHVDVLARLTKGLSDEERLEVESASEQLLADAQGSAWNFERRLKLLIADIKARTRPHDDVEEAERQKAASTVKRWTDKVTGMKHTMISLDPLRDEQLHKVIDAKLAELRQDPANAKVPFDQLKVMAVMAAVSAEAGAMGVAEVVIHTDAKTFCEGRHADTLCETVDGVPVPVATMHRFCCEAAITMVIVDADGTVRRLTEPRLANRAQRRVLAAMYSTCAHPLLHGRVLDVPDPPRRLVRTRRQDRHRQPPATLRGTPPPRPRRPLEPHHDPRPNRHLDQTRRIHLDHPPQHQPTTTPSRLNIRCLAPDVPRVR